MTYDPHKYWQDRGHWLKAPDASLEDRRELGNLAGWIREIQPKEILEIGSGHGRVYSHLKPLGLADDFTMCDFAASMLDGCQEKTGIRPDLWDGTTLPYDEGAFDLVLSFSVLLHVSPPDMARVLAEHVRVARGWMFIATCTKGIPDRSKHCFNHDYRKLFKGLKVVKERAFYGRSKVDWERTHWLLEK